MLASRGGGAAVGELSFTPQAVARTVTRHRKGAFRNHSFRRKKNRRASNETDITKTSLHPPFDSKLISPGEKKAARQSGGPPSNTIKIKTRPTVRNSLARQIG